MDTHFLQFHLVKFKIDLKWDTLITWPYEEVEEPTGLGLIARDHHQGGYEHQQQGGGGGETETARGNGGGR